MRVLSRVAGGAGLFIGATIGIAAEGVAVSVCGVQCQLGEHGDGLWAALGGLQPAESGACVRRVGWQEPACAVVCPRPGGKLGVEQITGLLIHDLQYGGIVFDFVQQHVDVEIWFSCSLRLGNQYAGDLA